MSGSQMYQPPYVLRGLAQLSREERISSLSGQRKAGRLSIRRAGRAGVEGPRKVTLTRGRSITFSEKSHQLAVAVRLSDYKADEVLRRKQNQDFAFDRKCHQIGVGSRRVWQS
jgi:hypothetical protein